MIGEAPIGKPLIKPVVYDSFFDDYEHVRSIVARNSPYWWLQRDFPKEYLAKDGRPDRLFWFRDIWMPDTADERERAVLLYNEKFINGSRECFVGFEIVRTQSVLLNLMGHASAMSAHFDLPYFRGLKHEDLPVWLLMSMGRSELFERWHINVSSGLAWLYQGQGGGLAYWAEGPDSPPSVIAPPLDNRALISDNQRMYHTVLPFGNSGIPYPSHSGDAVIVANDAGGWDIVDHGAIVQHYGRNEIRISILWKGYVFRDAEAARVHDQHLDDLSLEMAVDILIEGARRRGMRIACPDDPRNDVRFMRALEEAFPDRSLTPLAA
jgi:hypothetical protein